jgi:hypothetical protein
MLGSLQRPLALTMLGLFTLAAPALAQTEEPFTGSTTSDTNSVNIGDCFDCTEFNLTGSGTSLGTFTGSGHQRVDVCVAPDIEGEVTFTDQNGDEISIHYVGSRVDLLQYVCTISATGGTGRYEGAAVDGTLTITDYSIDHPFDATFDGTIRFPTALMARSSHGKPVIVTAAGSA